MKQRKSRKVVLVSEDSLLKSRHKATGLPVSSMRLTTKSAKQRRTSKHGNAESGATTRQGSLSLSHTPATVRKGLQISKSPTKGEKAAHANALTLKYKVPKSRVTAKKSVEVLDFDKIPVTIALHSDFTYTQKILKDAQAHKNLIKKHGLD